MEGWGAIQELDTDGLWARKVAGHRSAIAGGAVSKPEAPYVKELIEFLFPELA